MKFIGRSEGLPILIGLMTKKIEKPMYEKAIKEYLIAIKR